MSAQLKSLFVSHGAPSLLTDNSSARDFLAGFAQGLPRPRAILVASAHWETPEPTVSRAAKPETIHDFRGFSRELHEFQYPVVGAPDIADRVVELLEAEGLAATTDASRGLDHGAWVPLSLLYPDADVPVLQVSVQPDAGPQAHLDVGRALAPLASEGILLVGSGSLTHNLHEFFQGDYAIDSPPPDWVSGFGEWMHDRAVAGEWEQLGNYRTAAPHAVRNHPTEEHLLPFFVALGAAGPSASATRVHTSHTYGILQMDAYAFN